MLKNYEVLGHTADTASRVKSLPLKGLFKKACHGAGRLKSRAAALRAINSDILLKELRSKGIIVKASGPNTLAEEAPMAYKDINNVVDVVAGAGIGKRVCRTQPIGVLKG